MPPTTSFFSETWEKLKSPTGAAIMALVGLVSGLGIGIYGLVAERQPSLQFSVSSMSRVFDVHQSVGGLEVSYAGQDLRAAKQTLWSIAVVLANTGSAGIRIQDFDNRLPVALAVTNGVIVDRPTLSGAAEYLLKTFSFKQEQSSLVFEPFILDPKDGIHISLLVLGQEGIQPSLAVSGKIAGIKAIELIRPESSEGSPSTWRRVTTADVWWIHLLRAIVYGFGLLLSFLLFALLIVGILAPIQYFSDHRAIRERSERMSGYTFKPPAEHQIANDRLISIYEQKGRSVLVRLLRIKKTLLARNQLITNLASAGLSADECAQIARRRFPFYPSDKSTYLEFKSVSLIDEGASGAHFSEGLESALIALTSFLNIEATKANLVLEEYWQQEDVRMIPIEYLEREKLGANA